MSKAVRMAYIKRQKSLSAGKDVETKKSPEMDIKTL